MALYKTKEETLNISDSSHAHSLKPQLGQLSSSIDLINPDYWLIFCEISRGQQWDSFGADNSREAGRNPREVRRKGSAELGEGHSTFWLLRNQFPFSGKMSLVFYWPISFKSPTSFPGQPRHLWAKIGWWNSEQNNRCIKNTSVHNCMWLCWNQLLEDLCIFECAWEFTENLRMPMRVRVHMHVCAHVCLHARVCVSQSAEFVLHFEGQGRMVREPICSSAD